MATAYANAGGLGDRTASITVTAVHMVNPSRLVNGDYSNGELEMGGAWTDEIITFQFSSWKLIDAFIWEQQNATGQGNWDLEGSHDGSSWTPIFTNFPLVNGSSRTETTFTNTTAYRYYRLKQVSGSTSNSPWIHEIEFKIDAGSAPAAATHRSPIVIITQ